MEKIKIINATIIILFTICLQSCISSGSIATDIPDNTEIHKATNTPKPTPAPIEINVNGNKALLTEAIFTSSYNPGFGQMNVPDGKIVLVIKGKVITGSYTNIIKSIRVVDENSNEVLGMFKTTGEIEWSFLVDINSKLFILIINDDIHVDLQPLLT